MGGKERSGTSISFCRDEEKGNKNLREQAITWNFLEIETLRNLAELVSCCPIISYHQLSSLNSTRLPSRSSHRSEVQAGCRSLAQSRTAAVKGSAGCVPFQCCLQEVVLFHADAIVGKMQFLAAVRLRFPFSCWWSPRGDPGLLAVCPLPVGPPQPPVHSFMTSYSVCLQLVKGDIGSNNHSRAVPSLLLYFVNEEQVPGSVPTCGGMDHTRT